MPETVDDFMRRFGGGGTVDDEQAARYHDRFISTRPEDRHFDNRAYHEAATEYLGKLPDDQFRDAARNAVAQAPPQEKAGLLGSILSAMSGSTGGMGAAAGAGGLAGIASMLGLGSTDPNKMSEDDAARVMNYARKEHPEVMRQAVEEKPWFVKAMGNPVVIGALTVAAAKLLSNRGKNA
jgi:anti-sigma factor RsiW